MDRYTRAFIYASLLYLFAGVVIGTLVGAGTGGYYLVFVHTHFNLLGFMAMMIYGVGYFILPRFNATALRWPHWIPWHFWLANLGLLGMTIGYSLNATKGGSWFGIYVASSIVEALSIVMFVINIGATLLWANRKPAVTTQRQQPSFEISANTRVADLVDAYPQTLEVLIGSGLGALSIPGHIDQVRKMGVTLGMACYNHGIDLNELSQRLQEAVNSDGKVSATMKIKESDIIGDILKAYPQTSEVFKKFFGESCFSCPGQTMESVEQAASMHNVAAEVLVDELNKVL